MSSPHLSLSWTQFTFGQSSQSATPFVNMTLSPNPRLNVSPEQGCFFSMTPHKLPWVWQVFNECMLAGADGGCAESARCSSVGRFLVFTLRVTRQFLLGSVFVLRLKKKQNPTWIKGRKKIPLDSLACFGHFIYHLPWIKREYRRGDAERESFLRGYLITCTDSLHTGSPMWETGLQTYSGLFFCYVCAFAVLLALSVTMGVLAITEGETGTAQPYLPSFPMSLNAFYFEIPGGAWQR